MKRSSQRKNIRSGKRAKSNGKVRVPQELLEAVEAAGGSVEKVVGEDLYTVRVTHGDKAHEIFEEWVSALESETDPSAQAVWAPSASIVHTALVNHAVVAAVQIEANSIINYYAAFDAATFEAAPVPILPAPMAAPVQPMQVHHAKIALTKLQGRIQNPASDLYPTLAGLKSGSYICNVQITWSNAVETIALFKP